MRRRGTDQALVRVIRFYSKASRTAARPRKQGGPMRDDAGPLEQADGCRDPPNTAVTIDRRLALQWRA
jgi:hypothetical protein